MPAPYTGHLQRAPDGRGYIGALRDAWGWTIALTAQVETVDGVTRFAITGLLGPVPEALRLPGEEVADHTPRGAA